jgi:hypothetical protein
MNYIKDRDANLIGESDASVIDGNGTHAWILTTGEKEHLSDPYMKLEGHGPVNGDKLTMSSARGELQGQTALTIITEAFLSAHNETDVGVTLYMDNQGIQKSCNHPKIRRIGHHRKANMDLQMEQATRAERMQIKHEWVRGHQDKDSTWDTIDELYDLELSPVATLNVYCDRRASDAHKFSSSDPNADVLLAEKWALFSRSPTARKITGKINEGILQTLYMEDILAYISRKHNITEEKLYHIDTLGLQTYLKSSQPHTRASVIKLMHRWIPMNAFLHRQHCIESPLCTRCTCTNEDAHHIFKCSSTNAKQQRTEAMYNCLSDLEHANISKHILECLECKLTDFLQITSSAKYKNSSLQTGETVRALSDAQNHQNIIGWENALRGYTSTYWLKAQLSDQQIVKDNKRRAPWNIIFIRSLITLHKKYGMTATPTYMAF